MRQCYSIIELQVILDQYGKLGEINENKLFTSGYENSNYFIATEKGRYVIKIFEGEGMIPENIFFELEAMEYIYQLGLKVPCLRRSRAENLSVKCADKFAILTDYIEGENMDKKSISDQLAACLGAEAGKMDRAFKYFSDGSKTRRKYEWDLKNFLLLEDKIQYLPEKFDRGLFNNIFISFRKLLPRFLSQPTGLIHNDIGSHNVLARGDALAGIIDFSDLAYSPYIQNIAVSCAQLLFNYNWKPQQLVLFLQSYQRHNFLPPDSLSMLFDLTLARYATLIVEFNFCNIREGFDKQRSEAIEDYYIFLEKFLSFGRIAFNNVLSLI